MYREICQTDLSKFHSIVRGKSPKVSKKYILLYAVWQLLLYFYREFPAKILSVCSTRETKRHVLFFIYLNQYFRGENRPEN